MLSDFAPIVHRLPGRTIRIWPVADVHIGAKECDLDGFTSFLKRVEGREDDYLLLVGDLVDNGIRSTSSPTDIYAATMQPEQQIEKAVELLTPVAGKILGAVGGNHERRTTKAVNVDIMSYICSLLHIPELYRPNMAFIRISLQDNGMADRYALMMTHGKTENKKKQFTNIVEGVDACIYAHTHSPSMQFPASRIRFNHRNNISFHEVISMTACSWLKPGGYSLSSLYVPQVAARPQCLELPWTGSNSTKGRIRVIW